MAYDYDALYRNTPNALGKPAPLFVDFFKSYKPCPARVLDVGCGQGRDALFIARLGHDVTGVDLSASGIADLLSVAGRENLNIQGHVANITAFKPDGKFDIILIDRTLHMLSKPIRLNVLQGLLAHVKAGGWVLIADERKNFDGFQQVFSASNTKWNIRKDQRGYLFMQRVGPI